MQGNSTEWLLCSSMAWILLNWIKGNLAPGADLYQRGLLRSSRLQLHFQAGTSATKWDTASWCDLLLFLFFSLQIFLNSSSLCCNTYPVGSFVRSWTFFFTKPQHRSPSILRRRHQLRSLIWIHSWTRTRMWACWLSLQKGPRLQQCMEPLRPGQAVLCRVGQSNEGG